MSIIHNTFKNIYINSTVPWKLPNSASVDYIGQCVCADCEVMDGGGGVARWSAPHNPPPAYNPVRIHVDAAPALV